MLEAFAKAKEERLAKRKRLKEQMRVIRRSLTSKVIYFDFVDDASRGYGMYAAIKRYSPELWSILGPIHQIDEKRAFVVLIKLER